MWKQVFVQLPMNEIVEGSRNSARDTFTQILHSVQVRIFLQFMIYIIFR